TAHGDADFDAPNGFSARSFLVSPQDVTTLDASQNAWFDYSDLSFTARYVYLAVNVFETEKTVVMRFPIEQLASGAKPTLEALVLRPGTVRFVAGATDTMYFAQHEGTSRLNVWSWSDDAS